MFRRHFSRHLFFLLIGILLMAYLCIKKNVPYTSLKKSQNKVAHRLVIIHSYALDYEWTVGEDQGITQAIEYHQKMYETDWNVERFFLNGKKIQENGQEISTLVKSTKTNLKTIPPDGIILTDDLAFSLFYEFIQGLDIPVVFSGINGKIEDYGYTDQDQNITGTLERYNIASVVKIMTELRPTIENIVFVGDEGLTTKALFSDIKSQNLSQLFINGPPINFVYYSTPFFENLKSYLLSLDKEKYAIIYVAPYTYRNKQGNHVSYKDVDTWITKNTQFIDAGITSYQVQQGRLLSLASYQVESGYFCADKLFQALHDNVDLASIPIRKHLPLRLVLNHERAVVLNVRFPFSLISYSNESKKLFSRFDRPLDGKK